MKACILWTLPAIGFATAAVFVAPTLSSSPPGEALVVARPDAHLLHEASYRSRACQPFEAVAQSDRGAWRVGATVVSDGSGGFQIVLEDVDAATFETALFVIEADGRVFDLPQDGFALSCDSAMAVAPPV